MVDETEDVLLVSSDGIMIRLHADSVRLCRRPSKGVRLMRLQEGVTVVSMVQTARDDSEEVAVPEEAEPDADEAPAD